MTKYSKPQWDAICGMYRRGETTGELCKEYAVAKSTLYRQLSKRGISAHGRQPNEWEEDKIISLLRLRDQKFSFAEIAARIGVSRCAVAGMAFRLRQAGAH